MTRFLAIWAGQLVSLLGSGLTAFALAVWVYRETGEVGHLALLAAAAYLPHVMVAPYGGVLVDRFDPRIVMLVADTCSAVATTALLGCAAAGVLGVELAVLLVAASACANAVQWPAYEVAVVALVPTDRLGRANGLVELARGAGQLLAPILAGALFSPLGLTGIIAIDLTSFVVGIVPLIAIRLPVRPRAARTQNELRAAWRVVVQRSGLVAMLALFAATNFTFAVAEVVFRPLVLDSGEPWQLGVVLSTVGSGMVVGAIAMAIWGGKTTSKVTAILIFQLVEGGALVAAGMAETLASRCAAAFAYGLVIPLQLGCARIVWQVTIPYDLQGRVTALRNALVMLAIPIGYAAAAPLAALLGARLVLVAMGVVTWTAAVAVFGFAPYRRVCPDGAA